jgi:hypothetical protein
MIDCTIGKNVGSMTGRIMVLVLITTASAACHLCKCYYIHHYQSKPAAAVLNHPSSQRRTDILIHRKLSCRDGPINAPKQKTPPTDFGVQFEYYALIYPSDLLGHGRTLSRSHYPTIMHIGRRRRVTKRQILGYYS